MKSKITSAGNKLLDEDIQASKFARKLMEASVGPLVAISPEGNITDVNKALVKVIGEKREKLIGTYFFEYVSEPIKARKVCIEVFRKGSFKDIPLTLRNKQGKLTELIFSGSVYKDDSGIMQGAIMVAINITAQIDELGLANKQIAFQNKEKIKREDELFIANTELDFQNGEKLKRAEELIIANTELAFQNAEKIKRAEELIIANVELAFQNGEKLKRAQELIIANVELAFQNAEKLKRAEELIIANEELAFQNGEKIKRADELIIANKELEFQNGEKKKRADELILSNYLQSLMEQRNILALSINKQARHLADIVESSDDAIISKSLDGTIKSWNRGGEKMFGYTAKEVIGKNISLIIPTDYIYQEKIILDKICNNESIDNLETIRVKKGGERFNVSITVSPLKDDAGNIIGVSKFVRDISLRKQAEEQLIQVNKILVTQNEEKEKRAAELIIANKELVYQNEEKEKRADELVFEKASVEAINIKLTNSNREIEQFAYIASHDLQEPLRTILNYVGLFSKKYKTKLDNDADKYMDVISKATVRMQCLIRDLLDYSKIGMDSKTSVIDCNLLLKEVLNDMTSGITENHAAINAEVLPIIYGHTIGIKSLFQNLISNAIKFKKKETHPTISISAQAKSKEWLFIFNDNGIGIDKLYFEKLFIIFQRLHGKDEYPGTGIGLAQCKKVVELHGGKIWVESEPGKGSTFYFTILKP